MARLPRIFLTHTFYNGVACATGVMTAALAAYAVGGYGPATAVSSGALVVSISDMPTPRGHKFGQLLPVLLLAPFVTLIVGLSQGQTWLLGMEMVAVGLLAGLLSAWTRLLIPLSFGIVLAAIFALAFPQTDPGLAIRHALFFALGAVLYTGWGLALAQLLDQRTREQILADAIDEFARYLRLKADFYDPHQPLEQVFQTLAREHAVLAEKLQTARDFLLTGLRPAAARGPAEVLITLLEAYEHTLASQTDRQLLRDQYGSHPVMAAMGRHVRDAADDLVTLADAMLRGRSIPAPIPRRAGCIRTRDEVESLCARDRQDPNRRRAAILLRALAIKLLHSLESTHRVARTAAHREPGVRLPEEPALRPFVSNRHLRLADLRRQLTARSPVPRFALRLAAAMGVGFVLGRVLPYAAHGHWIMLTTAVVMRPSFSQTRQRHKDRVIGNLLGCALAALLLQLFTSPAALLPFLFVATAVAHAFITIRYRVTATAAGVMSLLQLHLLMPEANFAVVERVVDTVLGAAIGLGFSFLLPDWEHRGLPILLNRVRGAAARYIEATLDPALAPLAYRLARKQFMDAVAALSQATARMLDEPKAQQRPLAPLHGAVVAAYLLAAQLASVRFLLEYRNKDFDPGRRDSLLALARTELREMLDAQASAVDLGPADPQDFGDEMTNTPDPHLLLMRRLEAAGEDALRLACFTHDPALQA
ncbi:MAG: FUSC family protein [Zoogloeaceae bacterium]|nr:FUSC family protein [Zoogloeaceae bacterium]